MTKIEGERKERKHDPISLSGCVFAIRIRRLVESVMKVKDAIYLDIECKYLLTVYI